MTKYKHDDLLFHVIMCMLVLKLHITINNCFSNKSRCDTCSQNIFLEHTGFMAHWNIIKNQKVPEPQLQLKTVIGVTTTKMAKKKVYSQACTNIAT